MKRGQSAFEFLITYGWVFLIGLTTVFYLSSFGFLGGEKFLPDVCSIDSGFLCQESVFYTYDDEYDIDLYEGAGLIGLNIQNKNTKRIEHAYLVIDPEDNYCGGYFGIIASPLTDRVSGPMEVGESRLVKFHWLDRLCGPSYTCDENYECLRAFNICIQKASDVISGASDVCKETGIGSGKYYCEDFYDGACPGGVDCSNQPGWICVEDLIAVPVQQGENCYRFPQISTMNYLPCTCADKVNANYCPNRLNNTFNCCAGAYAKGVHPFLNVQFQTDLKSYGQGFCHSYTLGDVNYPNLCKGQPMDDLEYYTVDFSIFYKFVDSDLFHITQGYVKLKNSGAISTI